MLEIVLVGIVLISYIGILYSTCKNPLESKLFIFFFLVFLMVTLCIIVINIGIEINNTCNIPATFGFEGHEYIINNQGIIEHSTNCHCYD